MFASRRPYLSNVQHYLEHNAYVTRNKPVFANTVHVIFISEDSEGKEKIPAHSQLVRQISSGVI